MLTELSALYFHDFEGRDSNSVAGQLNWQLASALQEIVVENLLQADAIGRVCDQDSVDEIFGHVRDGDGRGVTESVGLDVLVGLLYGVVLEWRLPKEERVHDDPN